MMRSNEILNQSLSTLTKEDNKEIKDSKHSPVYRKRGVEGFTPLFSFFFVYLSKATTNMKLSLKIFIISLGVLLIFPKAQAQDIKPLIDLAFVDPDNNITAFQTAKIVVHVKLKSCATNSDTGFISGNLLYHFQTDKMGAISGDYKHEVDNDTADEQILPGGIIDTLTFTVDTAEFRTVGTNPVNVIIIWPAFVSASHFSCDSGETILWEVPGFVGIEEENYYGYGSTVYPNPAPPMQLVFINSKYSQEISRVSIVNAMGQVINTKEFYEGEDSQGYVLPTEELRAGIYNIHIFYKDKKNEVVKFVKN